MSAGLWRLTLAVIEPGNNATVEIEGDGFGGTEPMWFENEQTLTFVWKDGRRKVWSWASLLSAEYTPPAAPVSGGDGQAEKP